MNDNNIKFIDFTSDFDNFLFNRAKDYSLSSLEKYYISPFLPYLNLLKEAGGLWNDDNLRLERVLRDIDYYKSVTRKRKSWSLSEAIGEIHTKAEEILCRNINCRVVFFYTLGCSSDGITVYSQGTPVVFIGVDYPGADIEYIQLIASHELSHVARDTIPGLMEAYGAHIKMSQKEILSLTPFKEHFIGEGLATLFSSLLFPGKRRRDYLFYGDEAYKWCFENFKIIEEKILDSAQSRGNLGRFYRKDALCKGSVGREDYFFGFHIVSELIKKRSFKELIKMSADEILELYFSKKAGGSNEGLSFS